MANLALYRKYRPRTFDEVIGQEHVTGPLIQALKNGKLNHAYLFSGPRGCGKTSSARILARSLNCVEGPTPYPCGVCESCVALAPDGPGSLDVIEIDAASHGGVDDARDLRERAFFTPVSSRFKIYVIDEAHMVSSAGFNALLKLVEEPPDFVKFVFATTEPEKVLQTIRSRTHHYPFRLIPPGVMRGLLEQIATAENITIEPIVFPLVVRAGGGSARDSLSLLDQLLAGAGEEGVTYSRAVALLGVTDGALLDEACDALAAADGAGLFATVDRVVEAGHDPRRFAADLLERLRDLLILEKVPDAAAKGLIDVPADQLERMTGQALRLGGATLSRMCDVVHDGLVEMRGTTSPRLLLELVCARMLLPGADESQSALLQRLERLERRLEIAPAEDAATRPPAARKAAPAPRSAAAPAAEPSPAPAEGMAGASAASKASPSGPPTSPAAPTQQATDVTDAESPTEPDGEPPAEASKDADDGDAARDVEADGSAPEVAATAVAEVQAMVAPGAELDAAAVRRVWPDILERVKKRRVVWSLLQNATPRDVQGEELVLAVQHQGLARRFSDDEVAGLVQQAVYDVLGKKWKIRAETGTGATARAVPAVATRTATVAASVESAAAAPEDTGGWPAIAPVGPPQPDEPPPPPEPSAYDGFDPGDEPLDDPADEPAARSTSEQDALALLERTLGARKIDEFESR